jgi:hypothetical protein
MRSLLNSEIELFNFSFTLRSSFFILLTTMQVIMRDTTMVRPVRIYEAI